MKGKFVLDVTKKRSNCVLTPVLNLNCDFTPTFFHFAFLPLLFGNEASFYPYSVTALNGVKEDNFTFANIPLLFLKLYEYIPVICPVIFLAILALIFSILAYCCCNLLS